MALSNANNSTGDYFEELFEPKISKTIFMAISVVLNLFCVALCFCVIWYERYGLDVKRTIMNQLFSKLCWTGIEFILFITLPEWLRFFYGPFPRLPCWLHLNQKCHHCQASVSSNWAHCNSIRLDILAEKSICFQR